MAKEEEGGVTKGREIAEWYYDQVEAGPVTMKRLIEKIDAAIEGVLHKSLFSEPCEKHEKVTRYIVHGVPAEHPDCFGCYMDAVKATARREALEEAASYVEGKRCDGCRDVCACDREIRSLAAKEKP